MEGEVIDIIIKDNSVDGCRVRRWLQKLTTKNVILTAGTFLSGMIHIGNESFSAGRIGKASKKLANRMKV